MVGKISQVTANTQVSDNPGVTTDGQMYIFLAAGVRSVRVRIDTVTYELDTNGKFVALP